MTTDNGNGLMVERVSAGGIDISERLASAMAAEYGSAGEAVRRILASIQEGSGNDDVLHEARRARTVYVEVRHTSGAVFRVESNVRGRMVVEHVFHNAMLIPEDEALLAADGIEGLEHVEPYDAVGAVRDRLAGMDDEMERAEYMDREVTPKLEAWREVLRGRDEEVMPLLRRAAGELEREYRIDGVTVLGPRQSPFHLMLDGILDAWDPVQTLLELDDEHISAGEFNYLFSPGQVASPEALEARRTGRFTT